MGWCFNWTFWRLDMHSLGLKDPVWCLTTLGKAKAKFAWAKYKIRRLLFGNNHVYTEHHREWCELECYVAQRDSAGRVEELQEGESWSTVESGLSGGLVRRLQSGRRSKRPLRSPLMAHTCWTISVAQRTSKWGSSFSDYSLSCMLFDFSRPENQQWIWGRDGKLRRAKAGIHNILIRKAGRLGTNYWS